MSRPRLGFGGRPIGEATPDQRRPKQAVPCSAFFNTSNKETKQNPEKRLNTEVALNTEKTINFKSSDDILDLLMTHPDFMRVPPDDLEAIAAGLFAALILSGGVALTVVSGGISAVAAGPTIFKVLSLFAGNALTCAGAAGLQNAVKGGVQGTFSWGGWGQDMFASGATSILVFPLAFGAGVGAGYIAGRAQQLNGVLCASVFDAAAGKYTNVAAQQYISKCMKIATSLVYSVGQGGSDLAKSLIKSGKVDPISLVLSLTVGAWSGYAVGQQISELKTQQLIDLYIKKISDSFNTGTTNSLNEAQILGLLHNKSIPFAHALAKHGPGAMPDADPKASGFADLDKMVASILKATKESLPEAVPFPGDQFRVVFAYHVNNIPVWKNGDVKNYSGLVKVIVDLKPGQLPCIKTAYPQLSK